MKFKNFVEIVLFIVVLTGCIILVSNFFEGKHASEKYAPFFENYKDTNYDVLFLGTSHTYNGILSQELWKKYRITSYNMGSGCCTIPIDYYLLRQMCEYTKPKVVMIDLYGLCEYDDLPGSNGKYKPGIIDKYRVQFDAFPVSQLKIESVYDIFDNRKDNTDFIFNLAIYHNTWKEIDKENFEPRYIPQNGSAFLLGMKSVYYDEFTDAEHIDIKTKSKEYLDLIYDYCQENKIQLVFTYLPYVALDEQASIAYSFDTLMEEYPKADYLNLLNTGKINYSTDVFLDGSHLNFIGAYKTTEMIGDYLKNNYPKLVHKDKATLEFWNEYYFKYLDYKVSRFEKDELINNLQLVYGKDFYAIITLNNNSQNQFYNNADLVNLINELGDNVLIEVTDELKDECDFNLMIYKKVNSKKVFEADYKL